MILTPPCMIITQWVSCKKNFYSFFLKIYEQLIKKIPIFSLGFEPWSPTLEFGRLTTLAQRPKAIAFKIAVWVISVPASSDRVRGSISGRKQLFFLLKFREYTARYFDTENSYEGLIKVNRKIYCSIASLKNCSIIYST